MAANNNTTAMAKATVNSAGNITIGHYILGKALGKGTFGQVKLGTHILTGEKVAVKILEKEKINDQKDVERITREIKILKKVRHPHVIQLYEIIETDKELFMVMENANGGELFDFIVKHTRLQEKKAAKLFAELISGIEYLHKSGVCHRDLKPENLLLDYDNTLKIVDFGLSNLYEKGQTLKTACGSPCYAAPEMIAGKRYHGLQTDIWSSGVVFYAMVAGYLPFEDPKTSNLYKKIMSADYQMPKFLSPECKDFITKILNTDPEKRLTINDIRNHNWMKNNLKNVDQIPREAGLFPGLQKMPIDKEFLQRLIEDFNFEEDYSIRCMEANRHNHITATYHLLNKKNLRNQYMRETFSTHRKNEVDVKRERLQSQGDPKLEAELLKTNNRKLIEEELNQTMPSSVNTNKQKAADLEVASKKGRIGFSEVPKERRALNTIQMKSDEHNDRVIKSRITKQSVSPDKYQISEGLVVQLAESIKRPQAVETKKVMYQTQFKTNAVGEKATFFPSAETTTTGASSGPGSTDPRRTTDGGPRQHHLYSNQEQQRFQGVAEQSDLPLKFGKKQIRLSNGDPALALQRPSVEGGQSQTTKNAWQPIDYSSNGGSFSVGPNTTTSTAPVQLNTTNGIFNQVNSVNVSTKLQFQLMHLPEPAKNSSLRPGRTSPGGPSDPSDQRKNNFYTAIQGKGINIGGLSDQKKSILNKLFKGQHQAPSTTAGYGINGSFNEQLMNQTNFGFNPARQTIVNPADGVDPLMGISNKTDRQLATQRRNRRQPITFGDGGAILAVHNQRGASLNGTNEIQQIAGVKPSSQGGNHNSVGQRVNQHQTGVFHEFGGPQYNTVGGEAGTKQVQLKIQQMRKTPVTHHQQHRSNSHGANQVVQSISN